MKHVGTRIKEIRTLRRLSQEELATKMNYKSRSTINKIELGIADVSSSKIKEFARVLNVSVSYLMGWEEKKNIVPVLGTIPAGVPISAVENIIDYEEITPELASTGTFFALKIKGNSMSPSILENDIVIFRQTEDANSGSICAVMVNGEDATIKKIKKSDVGLYLIPINSEYEPMFFSNDEILSKPVRIIGKAIEVRRSL